jgi:hypothetical protein
MTLFEGYKKAHGIYSKDLNPEDSGKLKGKAATIVKEVTHDHWLRHIKGEQGLGIIPINENSQVKFGVIDVDIYPINVSDLNGVIIKRNYPLVPCRTKSGGVHLYLFLTEFHDAGVVQKQLREFAAALGFGGSEIFPKQSKIIVERGDIGQWINMPYFNSAKTTRYAYGPTNEALSLEEFIKLAYSRIISPLHLANFPIKPIDAIPDGPPCLNHLAAMGFPEGTRNNGLFNLGVYCQKVNPDGWPHLLEEMNTKFMDPPLTTTEVLGVIKSLQKKSFEYMCKQPPIAQYCNMPKCRHCKYGIGGGASGLPKLGSLTKLATSPPLWFIDIDGGGRLELTTEELQNQLAFQRRCMEVMNLMPAMMKRDGWEELIQGLMEDVTVIDVPPEATPIGMLTQHLEDFCTTRVQGKTHDELLAGKPWTNNGFHYFRVRDFLSYLERQKFTLLRLNHIAMHIKEMGAEKKFFNVKGKGVNCLMIPEFNNKQTSEFDVPKIGDAKPF